MIFSTFKDEVQYIFLERNFIFVVFLPVKVTGSGAKLGIFVSRKILRHFCEKQKLPVTLPAKNTTKMKFFSKKIYQCVSLKMLSQIYIIPYHCIQYTL